MMNKNFKRVLAIVLALVMVIGCVPFSFAGSADISGSSTADYKIDNPSFVTLSDTHVYTEELVGDGSKDYKDDVVKYNKLLGETFPILNAALVSIENSVKERGLRYVFLTGDLTSNGEEKNHELLGILLRSFQDVMRQKYDEKFHIFVVPGNHDISNYNGTKYDDSGKSVSASSCSTIEEANSIATSAAEFAYYYRGLGFGESGIDYYKQNYGLDKMPEKYKGYDFPDSYGSLSYAVDLEDHSGQKFRLIAIDACMYSSEVSDETVTIDGVTVQTDPTGGIMTDEMLDWTVKQTKEAVADNMIAIGMNHFAIMPHFTVQAAALKLFVLDDWQRISSTLADAGMHYMFTGHQHATDVAAYTSENGETIYDVETGSLANYSNTYRENKLCLNSDGSIDFDTVSRDCDSEQQVDLSHCWYEYDEDGNPIYVPLEYTLSADSEPFKKISKPFAQNYGIYLFAGTRLKADENGDSITTDANGNKLVPSLTQLATNMIHGYLDGRNFDNLIREGGAKSLVEGLLGQDFESFLDSFIPEDTFTISILTLKKSDILALANLIFEELDNSYLGYVDESGNVVRNNQNLLEIVDSLIAKLLNFEIAGHTLDEIVMQCVIANYDSNPVSAETKAWLNDVYDEIQTDKTIKALADFLVDTLLGYTTTNDDGETVQVKGELINLLSDLNISVEMIKQILPDFAGILRYPAIRTLLFGTTSKTPDAISIVDKWAGKIITDTYKKITFSTGETTEKNVTSTASLAEYFLFNLAEDYLTDDQIHAVSEVLNFAIQSFVEDPTSTAKSELHALDKYPFINNYDLKSAGLMTADSDDFKASINYKPLTPKTGKDAWYQIPNTVSVSFGADSTTSKNFNWFTTPSVTGTDVQIIPYKSNATAADFAGGSTVDFSISSKCETIKMTYPTLDIGVWTVGESMSMNRHTAEITGLSAGTKYCYRVGDAGKGYWTDPAVLETASGDDSSFTFFHMTDSQSQTQDQYDTTWGKVLNSAFSTYSDAKFILHTGDTVDYGSNMLQWSWALDEAGMHDTTIASTAGNHEPKGTNGEDGILTTAFGPSQDTFYNINHPEQDVSDGVYYDFDYNDAHFIVLNTNNLNEDGSLSDDQLAFVKKSASESTATWNIVAMHKSIYSNGSHYKDSDVVGLRNQLTKLMPELGIDIVFSGHDHVFVRTQAVANGKVASEFDANNTINNASGTVYSINGKSGVKDYYVKDAALTDEYFGFSDYVTKESYGLSSYSAVTIDGNKLTVNTYNVNRETGAQEKIDTFSLSKSRLEAPKNVKAVTVSDSNIKVSWDAVSGANAYELYRSTNATSGFEKIATLNTLSYTDNNVTAGTTYYYRIVAGTKSNKSSASTAASAKATIAAVTGFRATKKTSTSIQTSWSKNTQADSYKVYIATSANGTFKLASTVKKPDCVITGLTKGKTYYVKVYACSNNVLGVSSSTLSVKL